VLKILLKKLLVGVAISKMSLPVIGVENCLFK